MPDSSTIKSRSGTLLSVYHFIFAILYLLLIAGFDRSAFAQPIPDNDNFAARIPLYGTNVTAGGSNVGATVEPNEPDPSFSAAKSVWWTWTAPVSGYVTLTTAGSTFDTMLTVFSGTDLTNLNLIAYNDTETNTSQVHFNATAGTAYQIDIDGADGPSGTISLHLTIGPLQTPPPNDSFNNRITIAGTHLSNVTGSNAGATREPGEPFHCDDVGGKSVWWTWTAPSSGWLTLTTSGSSFDTLLAVYTGNSVSNLTFIAGNDEDPTSQFGLISRVTCNVISNTTYQIAVDGFDDDSGSVRLQLDLGNPITPPANDNFTNRTLISGSSISVTASNIGAAFEAIGADFEAGEPEHAVTFGGKSVWWTWTAPSSGRVTLSTSNSTFDTILAVYTGDALTNLAFVAANDEDFLSPDGLTSRVNFNATSGTTYQIAVDGFDGDSGVIKLRLTMGSLLPVPANDHFENRVLLSGSNPTASGSTLGGTFEINEPLHNNSYGGKSVWWQWISPGPGIVTIDTIGSDFDTLLAVYTGSSLSNLTTIASDDESGGNYTSRVTFYTKAGVTNQIAVDGYDCDSGTVSLHIAFTPASYSLTLVTNPSSYGTINIDPGPDQDGKYAPDSVVTLVATALEPGTDFSSWTGTSLTNNPLSIGMNSNKTITGNFFFPPPKLKPLPGQTKQTIQAEGFRLLLSGPASFPYAYAVESSTNLTTWTSLVTNQFTSSQSSEVQDFNASNSPTLFYRARRLQ